MNETKLIKGQAWISGNSLVQDQIMVVPGVDSFSNTICLIQDIWADLTSASGQYKTNQKKDYFYWEIKQTTLDNPDVEITVNFECPKPKSDLFIDPETKQLVDIEDVQGDYAKYWVNKLKIAEGNASKATIQKKEIIFPETEYLSFTDGEFKHIEEKEVRNDDLGPIDNLLNLY